MRWGRQYKKSLMTWHPFDTGTEHWHKERMRNKATLSTSPLGSKELWEKVHLITGKTTNNAFYENVDVDAEQLNQYYRC